MYVSNGLVSIIIELRNQFTTIFTLLFQSPIITVQIRALWWSPYPALLERRVVMVFSTAWWQVVQQTMYPWSSSYLELHFLSGDTLLPIQTFASILTMRIDHERDNLHPVEMIAG